MKSTGIYACGEHVRPFEAAFVEAGIFLRRETLAKEIEYLTLFVVKYTENGNWELPIYPNKKVVARKTIRIKIDDEE